MINRPDALFQRLENWFELPGRGFVTTPECPEPTRSDCHAWGSHPLFRYYATILGIRPAAMGFAEVSIRPQLGPLKDIKCRMVHPQGWIEANLRRAGDKIEGEISLPEGVTGIFHGAKGQQPLKAGPQKNLRVASSLSAWRTPRRKRIFCPKLNGVLMKILLWCDSFWPLIGGLESFILRLAIELVRRGHSVLVVTETHFSQPGPDSESVPGVPIHRFPFRSGIVNKDIAALRTIHETLLAVTEDFDPDVIHANPHHLGAYYYAQLQKARASTRRTNAPRPVFHRGKRTVGKISLGEFSHDHRDLPIDAERHPGFRSQLGIQAAFDSQFSSVSAARAWTNSLATAFTRGGTTCGE